MARRSGSRRFKVLLMVGLFGIVAWSVVWFVAATIVDRQLDRAQMMAADRGATIDCANRSVTGYPFRIEVRCGARSSAEMSDGWVSLEGVRVAAQIYEPGHLIAEIDGPMALTVGPVEVAAQWTLAHASARVNLSDQALRSLIAEVKGLTLDLANSQDVSVREVDASVRRDPTDPADLDIAIRLADFVPGDGLMPATLSVQGRIGDGATLLDGQPDAVLARLSDAGLPITIERATFESGDMLLVMTGALDLGADGLINGKVDISVAGYEADLPYISVMDPRTQTVLSSLLTDFLANAPKTRIGEREARTISVVIDDNKVKPGGWLPVATLPRVPIRFR